MFRWLIMTPAGRRVEPEVYCRYAVVGASFSRKLEEPLASRSSASTSMVVGAAPAPGLPTYSETDSATADVVRITEGEVSSRTALTRSSCAPTCGTVNGTAMH